MKETVKLVELDSYEHSILINALNELRNLNIEKHNDTYVIDELLLKIIDAPSKKVFRKIIEAR